MTDQERGSKIEEQEPVQPPEPQQETNGELKERGAETQPKPDEGTPQAESEPAAEATETEPEQEEEENTPRDKEP